MAHLCLTITIHYLIFSHEFVQSLFYSENCYVKLLRSPKCFCNTHPFGISSKLNFSLASASKLKLSMQIRNETTEQFKIHLKIHDPQHVPPAYISRQPGCWQWWIRCKDERQSKQLSFGTNMIYLQIYLLATDQFNTNRANSVCKRT